MFTLQYFFQPKKSRIVLFTLHAIEQIVLFRPDVDGLDIRVFLRNTLQRHSIIENQSFH